MEEWKSIPGYEGLYEVSNLGRVKTLDRDLECGSSSRHQITMIKKQRFFKRANRLDAVVSLSKNGVKKTYRVARLVAAAFCPGYAEGLTVNHIDGNTLNNNADNLEWISNEDNIKHGHAIGLYKNARKPCSIVDSNGIVRHFDSQADASRSIGRRPCYIAACIYAHVNIRSANGELYGLV